MAEEAVISLRGVTKSFGGHTVLQDISFDVPKGRITAIMGPSGTGKSVMLKNIIGLLTPEAGEIWVEGEQVVGMRDRDLYRIRRKMGVLFQDGALFGSQNLFDNIAFPLREHTKKTEKEIVLYCRGGHRSALAADSLRQMGYTNVHSMIGGFRRWSEEGRPITHEDRMIRH